jgi:hypothetical protein
MSWETFKCPVATDGGRAGPTGGNGDGSPLTRGNLSVSIPLMGRSNRELGNEQYRVARWGRCHHHRDSQPGGLCLSETGGRVMLPPLSKEKNMNSIVWLVGAVVIVIAVLSFVGIA